MHIPEESGASSSSAYQPPREEITPQLPIAEEHTSEEESTTELLVFNSTITSEFLENPRWLSRACQCQALHQAAHDKLVETQELIEEGLTKYTTDWSLPQSFLLQDSSSSRPTTWSRDQAHFVFPGPWKTDVCFFIDLYTGEALKVDDQTGNLTEAEIAEHWDLVEAADRKEITQFVEEKV